MLSLLRQLGIYDGNEQEASCNPDIGKNGIEVCHRFIPKKTVLQKRVEATARLENFGWINRVTQQSFSPETHRTPILDYLSCCSILHFGTGTVDDWLHGVQ